MRDEYGCGSICDYADTIDTNLPRRKTSPASQLTIYFSNDGRWPHLCLPIAGPLKNQRRLSRLASFFSRLLNCPASKDQSASTSRTRVADNKVLAGIIIDRTKDPLFRRWREREKERRQYTALSIIDAAIFSKQVVPIAALGKNYLNGEFIAGTRPAAPPRRRVGFRARGPLIGVGPLMTAHGGLVLLGPRVTSTWFSKRAHAALVRIPRIFFVSNISPYFDLIIKKKKCINHSQSS